MQKGCEMKDNKGYEAFTKQIDVFDVLWLNEEIGIALCDNGSDDDVLYLIKDKVPFEFYKLMDKSLFVNFFECMCKQLVEMVKRGEK